MFHGMKGQASKLCAYLCGGINLSDHLNFLHQSEAIKTVHSFFGGRLNQFKKIYRMKGQASNSAPTFVGVDLFTPFEEMLPKACQQMCTPFVGVDNQFNDILWNEKLSQHLCTYFC